MLKVFDFILLSIGFQRGDRAQKVWFNWDHQKPSIAFLLLPLRVHKRCWHNVRLMLMWGLSLQGCSSARPASCSVPSAADLCGSILRFSPLVDFLQTSGSGAWLSTVLRVHPDHRRSLGWASDPLPTPTLGVWKEIFAGLLCFSETRRRLFIAHN